MKEFMLILMVIFSVSALSAQSSQKEKNDDDYITKIVLDHFPDIPNLTTDQKEEVGNVLVKEKEHIDKELKNKEKLKKEIAQLNSQDEDKLKDAQTKVDKIDKKIADIRAKSNNKIQKTLSIDQYSAFLTKKEEVKFKEVKEKRVKRSHEGFEDWAFASGGSSSRTSGSGGSDD